MRTQGEDDPLDTRAASPAARPAPGPWGRGSALSKRQVRGRCTGREWGPGATLVPELSPTRRSPERPPLSDGGLRIFTPHRAQLGVLPGWLSEPGHRQAASHQQSACEGQRPPRTRPLQSQTEARFPPPLSSWGQLQKRPSVDRPGTQAPGGKKRHWKVLCPDPGQGACSTPPTAAPAAQHPQSGRPASRKGARSGPRYQSDHTTPGEGRAGRPPCVCAKIESSSDGMACTCYKDLPVGHQGHPDGSGPCG